jgi:hypothetical protein
VKDIMTLQAKLGQHSAAIILFPVKSLILNVTKCSMQFLFKRPQLRYALCPVVRTHTFLMSNDFGLHKNMTSRWKLSKRIAAHNLLVLL